MRVLVCGGRDYQNGLRVFWALDGIHAMHDITLLIHGAASGADTLATNWAHENGVEISAYPAQWGKHGKGAGPIRNQQMLDVGKPDLVVAFPGGKGTADMVRRARAAGVDVREIKQTERSVL